MNQNILAAIVLITGILLIGTAGYFVSASELPVSPSPSGFFPIGLYAVDDYYPRSADDPPSKMTVLEELPQISRAGFNVIQGYRFEVASPEWGNTNENARIFLDAARKSGLKVIMGLHFSWIDPGDLNAIRARVRLLKDHPALFGWILYDDCPQGGGPGVTPLMNARNAVKAIDPIHPLVIAVPGWVDANYEYRDVADIYMPDNFPIGFEVIPPGLDQEWEMHPEAVGQFIDAIYEVIGPKQKVMAHVQTLNSANDSLTWGKMPRELGRYPTRAEMRFMAYDALIHKSQGVFFNEYRHHYENYNGGDGGDGVGGSDTSPRGNASQWKVMASVAAELKSLAPVFLAPDTKKITVKSETDGIEFLLRDYNNKLYLIAANPSDRGNETKFTVSQPVTAINVLNESRSIIPKYVSFTDSFDAYGVHCYEISTAVGK